MLENKKIHLVLASGGARGVAHIGVIERLLKHNNEIVEVAGCSMGAVIGGLFAAGKLEEYKKWLLDLQRTDVFRQLDFTFAKHGFLKGEKVFSTITDMLGPQKIEDLKIPFKAVATNLKTGEEIVFEKGDLYQALRASISIPGIFTPIKSEQGEDYLVDGGVINPLPLNMVKKKEGHVLVAVDINGPGPVPKIMQKESNSLMDSSWLKINWPFFKKEGQSDPGLIDVIQASYEHMQNRIIKRDVAEYNPDVFIQIPRSTCGVFDFHRSKDLIEVGHEAFDNYFKK